MLVVVVDCASLGRQAVLGCDHYARKCRIVAPCCGEVFWCRLCHDAAKEDGETNPKLQHKINRYDIRECVCAVCGLQQPVSNTCQRCATVFGAYHCKVLWLHLHLPARPRATPGLSRSLPVVSVCPAVLRE
jgi:hypothetical protein